MSARDAAVATIKQEHHALTMVVQTLQRLLGNIAVEHAEPDFALLSAALYYIDDFPERCHHPKEDAYLFKALRRHTTEFNGVLDDLQAEHVRGAHMMAHLQQALIRYQGGAAHGFRLFRTAVNAYAAMLEEHMRKEEDLLTWAQAHLPEAEWTAIASAFDANDDPLFGLEPREEFRRLYQRIVNRLPRKLRMQMQHDVRSD